MAAASEELVVAALLDHLALVQHHDPVRIAHRG
jgi:hypothetical protein